jgi:hypothetical protein
MGTFDVSNRGNSVKRVAGRVLKFTPKEENLMLGLLTGIENLRDEKGGDLLRLDSLNKPAAIETKDGWGMRDRWGYRAVFTFPNTNAFFMGDAGTFNKVGGWVLHELTPQARPVGPAKQRTVGSSIYELVLTAAKVGLGSATTTQSTLRISEGQGVDFKARLRNRMPVALPSTRICIRPPRGFKLGSNPKAEVARPQACFNVRDLPARGTRTVVLHTTAAERTERRRGADASSSRLNILAGCVSIPMALEAQADAGTDICNSGDDRRFPCGARRRAGARRRPATRRRRDRLVPACFERSRTLGARDRSLICQRQARPHTRSAATAAKSTRIVGGKAPCRSLASTRAGCHIRDSSARTAEPGHPGKLSWPVQQRMAGRDGAVRAHPRRCRTARHPRADPVHGPRTAGPPSRGRPLRARR